jgi:hypothetical protein
MLADVGLSTGPSDWRDDRCVYRWSAGRTWIVLPERTFTYEAYAGRHEPTVYRKRCLDDFREHLDKYLDEEKQRAYSLTPKYRPSDYDLLALYRCRQWSPRAGGKIMRWLQLQKQPDGNLDETNIAKRIRAAAKSIGLGMRKSGRPPSHQDN